MAKLILANVLPCKPYYRRIAGDSPEMVEIARREEERNKRKRLVVGFESAQVFGRHSFAERPFFERRAQVPIFPAPGCTVAVKTMLSG